MMSGGSSGDQRSKDLVALHQQALLSEAERIWNTDPKARVVGLVLERDAPQLQSLRPVLPVADEATLGFAGVIPRMLAVELIARSAPQGLDWLFDEGTPPRRQLPVLVCLSDGIRTAAIGYMASS